MTAMKDGSPVVPLLEKIRRTSSSGAARWRPSGGSAASDSRISSLVVNGSASNGASSTPASLSR